MAPRCLALLLPLTASACIDAPVAGELQLEDLALQGEAGWLARPDQVRGETPPPAPRPVATAGAIPRVVVGPLGAAPVDEYGLADGAARCPFEVEALGFPAVTTDGTRAVASVRYVPSASDGEDERMAVFWRAVEDDAMLEERTVFDGMESGGFSREPGNCAALHARARRAAAAINVRLAEDEWRTMHPLAIGIHDEGWFDYDVEARQDLLTRAPSDRPPELTWRWGSLVARIPGVNVLARVPVKWWGSDDPDFCDATPHMRAVFADPVTGATAIALDHQSGACLCYPPDEVHVVRLPPAVFAAVAERPAPDAHGES